MAPCPPPLLRLSSLPPFRPGSRAAFVPLRSGSHLAPYFCGAQEVQDGTSAPPVCEQVPDLVTVLSTSCLLPHFRPQDLLLRLPPRAVLKQVFPCLRLVLAPPAFCAVCVPCPFQVLPCAAVPRSELVIAFGQAFWRSFHPSIRPLALRQLVLLPVFFLLLPRVEWWPRGGRVRSCVSLGAAIES